MKEVHHFKFWDIKSGDWVIPPLKSTAERIKKAGGKIIPNTMEMVPNSAVDSEGRCIPNKTGDKNA